MSVHNKSNNRDFRKKGMTVLVKQSFSDNPEERQRQNAKAVESAIRTLKRRSINEGLVKELRAKEFHVTRGQKRRKSRQDAIARERARHREEMSEWDSNFMLGVHRNKKKRRRKQETSTQEENS